MGMFPKSLRFEFGIYVDKFVRWLQVNFESFFDFIKEVILGFLLNVERFLLWIPWWLVIIAVFLIGWKIKNWKSGLLIQYFFS